MGGVCPVRVGALAQQGENLEGMRGEEKRGRAKENTQRDRERERDRDRDREREREREKR